MKCGIISWNWSHLSSQLDYCHCSIIGQPLLGPEVVQHNRLSCITNDRHKTTTLRQENTNGW